MQQLIKGLIEKYGFELNGETSDGLVRRWLDQYEQRWVRLAIIEALYQGRYKVISVEQILNLWHRRGNAKFHFSHEFERLICRRLPKTLQDFSQQMETAPSEPTASSNPTNPSSNPLDEPTHQQHREPEPSEPSEPSEQSEEKEAQQQLASESINRFTPLFDRSQFYSKLKAVANE